MEKPLTYRDTRGHVAAGLTFSQVVLAGMAPGGGLFVPETLPSLDLDDILALHEIPYWQRAAYLFGAFGVDLEEERIAELMRRAYGKNFDDERIAPTVEVVPDMYVLELWHGPTSAFKDMALQCMPLFFSESVEAAQVREGADEDYLILVATSGDTGKAALEGFADRDHTSIIVFYPDDGVSELQRKQMVTQRGENVGVFGVRGNFDDCQSSVKAAFADPDFGEWLLKARGLRLSSANSINWGRLLPQVVYYVSAYADMVAEGAMKAGEPMDVCVPTGNFGNILGAYYAHRIGVPIGRLICASNENNVLADFIATGVYDISGRTFVTTPSPSMDILISSNLERLLFELADADRVREWMDLLAEQKRFQVDRETYRAVRELFVGDWVSNSDSLATIARVWDEQGYLLDPHTAVAWEVAERLRGEAPLLVVSTAHWAKFGADVLKALKGVEYSEPLPEPYSGLGGVALLEKVQAIAEGCTPAPDSLMLLDEMPERFTDTVDPGRESVEDAVKGWLEDR